MGGAYNQVDIGGGEVFKLSREIYPSYGAAAVAVGGIRAYYDSLTEQPLDVAELHDIDVVDADGGFQIRQACELITGPCIADAPSGQLPETMASLLGQIGAMDIDGDADSLLVPIDSRAANYHIRPSTGEAVLIDYTPALVRQPDGMIMPGPDSVPGRLRRHLISYWMGAKSGAMTWVLGSAVLGKRSADRAIGREDWYHDAIPEDVDSKVKDRAHRNVRGDFLAFKARYQSARLLQRIQ